MSLEDYQAKRDFKKTAEPGGEKQDTGKSRFVVQRQRTCHYWERVSKRKRQGKHHDRRPIIW